MSRRPPSEPPVISGFDYVQLLGTGGFADVFLYQQRLPRRRVAVKVLLSERLGDEIVQRFTDEANLMAQFATHPSIVSVYEAGIATDGRPYLVMEYCSKPNLQVRHQRERFSEADTLRIGVQIAGAVETAHRAGILHRDIKPANILVTDYGRPALADFGIAATAESEGANGMSVPWSPAEAFLPGGRGDARSDVYSLAATLYTLLANRSPYEIAGRSNSQADQIARIQSGVLPPLGRPDVSPAFDQVLRTALARDPDARYASAREFARALQAVQIGLGMQETALDVLDDDGIVIERDDSDDGDRTRFRGMVSIDAQSVDAPVLRQTGALTAPVSQPVPPAPTSPTAPLVPVPDAARLAEADTASTVKRPQHSVALAALAPAAPAPRPAPPVGDTVVRPTTERLDGVDGGSDGAQQGSSQGAPSAAPRPRRALAITIASAAAVLVAAGIVFAAVLGGALEGEQQPGPSDDPAAPVDAIVGAQVPQPTQVTGVLGDAGAVFTWQNPEPEEGDTYLWRVASPGTDSAYAEVSEPTVTVTPVAEGQTCVEVLLRRAKGRTSDEPATGCTT